MKTNKNTITKTLIGLGLIVMIAMPLALNAKEGNEELKKENISKINLPASLKKTGYNEKVKVYYVIDKNGKVTNVAASTENKELKSSVENQFKKLSFPGMTPNIGNIIIINFKVY